MNGTSSEGVWFLSISRPKGSGMMGIIKESGRRKSTVPCRACVCTPSGGLVEMGREGMTFKRAQAFLAHKIFATGLCFSVSIYHHHTSNEHRPACTAIRPNHNSMLLLPSFDVHRL